MDKQINTIKESYDYFLEKVVISNLPDELIFEYKKSFYAGAFAMFEINYKGESSKQALLDEFEELFTEAIDND